MKRPDLEQTLAEIMALSPADQLRLAADLLDAGKSPRFAHRLAERVVLELGAVLALTDMRNQKPPPP